MRGGDRHERTQQRQEVAALHARLPATQERFRVARERAERFLNDGPAYVAWSGGKDSTVVAHLVTSIEPTVPLCHYDSRFDFPETIEYQDRLAAEHGWDLRRYSCGDALEEMLRTGSWDHEAEDLTIDGADSEWLWVTRLGPAQMAADDTGATGHFWGLRAAEAKRRLALMARTRGTHTRKDGWRWCSPIWDWRDKDIWAYHAWAGLPENPVYRRLEEVGAPPGAQRVGFILDPGGLRQGRAVWLRRGWPDLWNELVLVLPRLREDS